jgi:hypothetical protein
MPTPLQMMLPAQRGKALPYLPPYDMHAMVDTYIVLSLEV